MTRKPELRESILQAARALREMGASEVYLFGSARSGEIREDSDIDLAVSGLPPQIYFRARARAGDILGREIDLICLDEENPFTRYLREEEELERVA